MRAESDLSKEPVVVIGGDAAGMSAASKIRREQPERPVVVFERTAHTSYSACGNPYYISGLVGNADALVARSPETLRQKYAIDVRTNHDVTDVAVRSSATAEDLPEASLAGQQETFLNISGVEELIDACRRCYASLFTDRAITSRRHHGFDHLKVALSIGVQKMVRSDTGCAGVMFSIDTETGLPDVVVVNGSWGLGENVVKGTVTPDEYGVFKPLLDRDDLVPIIGKTLGSKEQKLVYAKGGSHTTRNVDTPKHERRAFTLEDEEVLQLAKWAVTIERHYERPMDMEWAKGQEVTLSCAEGDRGFVYEGTLKFEVSEVDIERVPKTQTRIMMDMASPAAAFRWWRLPADGIGLARMEFIIKQSSRCTRWRSSGSTSWRTGTPSASSRH